MTNNMAMGSTEGQEISSGRNAGVLSTVSTSEEGRNMFSDLVCMRATMGTTKHRGGAKEQCEDRAPAGG